MLCVRLPELIHLLTADVYSLTSTSPVLLPPTPGNDILLFLMNSVFLDSTHKGIHTVLVFLCLTSLS